MAVGSEKSCSRRTSGGGGGFDARCLSAGRDVHEIWKEMASGCGVTSHQPSDLIYRRAGSSMVVR